MQQRLSRRIVEAAAVTSASHCFCASAPVFLCAASDATTGRDVTTVDAPAGGSVGQTSGGATAAARALRFAGP